MGPILVPWTLLSRYANYMVGFNSLFVVMFNKIYCYYLALTYFDLDVAQHNSFSEVWYKRKKTVSILYQYDPHVLTVFTVFILVCLYWHTSQGYFCHRTFYENTGLDPLLPNSLALGLHSQPDYTALLCKKEHLCLWYDLHKAVLLRCIATKFPFL